MLGGISPSEGDGDSDELSLDDIDEEIELLTEGELDMELLSLDETDGELETDELSELDNDELIEELIDEDTEDDSEDEIDIPVYKLSTSASVKALSKMATSSTIPSK